MDTLAIRFRDILEKTKFPKILITRYLLEVTPPCLSNWLSRGEISPAYRERVEKITSFLEEKHKEGKLPLNKQEALWQGYLSILK